MLHQQGLRAALCLPVSQRAAVSAEFQFASGLLVPCSHYTLYSRGLARG